MRNQPPSSPAYQLPATGDLAALVDEALEGTRASDARLAKVMCVVTAAAVRDILTGNEPDGPFDAVRLELTEGMDAELFPTGRYWTAAGEPRTFTEAIGETDPGNAVHDLTEWTTNLNDRTRHVWYNLCTELDDRNDRPAYALDLIAAARVLDEPAPAERPLSAMVDVMVCANDEDRYPAKVDPGDQRDGHVKPWFDLDTVRRIAENTQADAERYGHGSIDTVHVLDGTVDGTAHAVVLVISWMYLGSEWRKEATEILQPNAVGRYAVGGHDWCWYAVDDDLKPQIPFTP
ncbi:hypothetical protein PV387_03575 [Streptomyces sp. ME02-6987-2C]|uniref:hypothetical protein n=1 Tax=unclassified Streptomyces TaxID=2593676 RepID=UPI0029B9CD90|nr:MULTISPECIES: hypothetical protein [unclassified Streptomyces]MDX3345921.1 hypothetical protein [Streptomyces sp. ME02-6979A]MDX3365115.1 hypothetical protein [Streptomyces sp. ME02-6987-2C]MDX3404829.1 hypothetical protein [Streptomyces sp. ME02-6977A]MDX3421687.1 hypothetical protein [Streptomyces sp. ME02-6985-2c]